MIRVKLSRVMFNARFKPEGYQQDVLASGRIVGDYVEFEDSEYMRLKAKYSCTLTKATRYVSAAISKVSTPEIQSARLAACDDCEHSSPSKVDPSESYCRACGCGDVKRAFLSRKVTMTRARCPIGRWES